MSDDRTTALENLYAAPAGQPSGNFLSGSLTAIPAGLADASAQLNLEAQQAYHEATLGLTPLYSDSYVQQQTGMSKEDVMAHERQALADVKQRQADVSSYLQPNPQTSGIVAKTLYGLTDIGARATIGTVAGGPLGGAALAGVSTGTQATTEAEAQGVDEATATKLGIATGALNAVGLRIPMGLGGAPLMRILTGGAINTAMNLGGQQLSSKILADNGYKTMADQYAQIDASSVAADLILGGYFGLKHVPGRVPAEAVDASAEAQAQQRYQTEAAPGAATSIDAINGHAKAMDTALSQLLNDEPVQVGNALGKSEFIPMPDPENRAQSVEALQEAGYKPSPDMSDEGIASRFAEQLSDYDQAKHQYASIPETEGGKVINTDIARELSPDYMADRTRSAAVHEPASAFTKEMYADLLSRAPKEWEEPQVMFTAGGTGAGKTTGVEAIPELAAEKAKSQIVYDTNMNKFESADQKIQQALAAGKNVHIAYTFRDPIDALTHGALPRAERQRAEFGTGRTVPMAEHLKTHVGALETMQRIAEKYKDDPRVKMDVVNNSFGLGEARKVDLADLKLEDENTLNEKLKQALEHEYQAGKISEETYRGFGGLGESVRGGDQLRGSEATREGLEPTAARGEGNENARGMEENASARNPEAGTRSQEEELAAQITAEKPDAQVSYLNDAGEEVTETASEALARQSEETDNLRRMGDAVRAAVACALRFGE